MGNAVRKAAFYKKRGGAAAAAALLKRKAGIYSQAQFEEALSQNARFAGYFRNLPYEKYEEELKEQFRVFGTPFGVKDIDDPKTFNEKLNYIKVHDHSPLRTRLTDKWRVRAWVAERLGEEYLVPLAGGPYSSADEIDFDSLPDKFVLKYNGGHGGRMNLIVRDKSKLDEKKARETASRWLNTMYGWNKLEAQYFHIEPKLIAEEYIEQMDGGLYDYKFYCFGGEPRLIKTIGDRGSEAHSGRSAMFDPEWNELPFNTGGYSEWKGEIARPDSLGEMLEAARKLSRGFAFVRVDLYDIGGKVLFGEMTFTPGNGTLKWIPEEANAMVGEWLDVSYLQGK